MATVRGARFFGAVGVGIAVGVVMTVAAAGCGNLKGLGGSQPPLVTFNVMTTGAAPAAPRSLQVALIWGAQWLTEPFCVLPAESDKAAAIIAAGCRDPFGFVPARVAMSVPITPDAPASLSLFDLPSADVMVGDITARVAYGSLVVYDDRDKSGTLELATPHRTPSGGRQGEFEDAADSADVVYGASFITMTAPDQRVAYREGKFNAASAFYPRSGCDDPPPGFAVIGAGGFTREAGLASAAAGQLPPEDPSACTKAPADAVINVALQASSADLREVGCVERANDSSTRYREPPTDAPDFSGRLTACAHLPAFDAGGQSSLIQLVVSGRADDRCMGLTHYTLRGCRENVSCPVPDWDFTATPPTWWPCPH
ncbi:MAG: hypothetical protein QOI66_4412 [Myxococcales bacterium]|jgi:hypothetical protein|nr:hypothetical protein [Myxococcales bacterium]